VSARRDGRELDVVLFGATGFVGRLTAEHLAAAAPPGVRIGLAGRSAERLAAVRDGLGAAAAGWPLLVADAADPASLARMAERTAVVATTVGPYASQGLALVEACARAGTDCADLTGEVPFVRASIDAAHELAVASGARVVHGCGFDAVPSDLGVLAVADAARAGGAGPLGATTLVVREVRGGLSGGTLATMRAVVDAARRDPGVRRLLADDHALSPDRAGEPDRDAGAPPEPHPRGARWEAALGTWTAPFVMASFNTRVVRRSSALQGWAYGRGFRYREVVACGTGPLAPVRAAALTAGLGAGAAALLAGSALPPVGALLARVLPGPGQGPSERTRREGRFALEVVASTESGARYLGRISATGDPGYAATAVMFGEASLCLALDRERTPQRGGVLTPATAMGSALADRLRAAGMVLSARRA